MDILNIAGGTALILLGVWLAVKQSKNFINGRSNTLGGIGGLLIIGIVCVIGGIILIVKHV